MVHTWILSKVDSMKKVLKIILISLAIIYLVLLIPTEKLPEPKLADKIQFLWNRDSLWLALEQKFVESRTAGCEKLNDVININILQLEILLRQLANENLKPTDPLFENIERHLFATAPLIGGCTGYTFEFMDLFSRIRNQIKKTSRNWNPNDFASKQTLYKIIYGGRAAVEEVMLQSAGEKVPALVPGDEEKSVTPSASILEVKIHSGDILVSRGGAPTSALIARGNDFPGNFSHVALVYIDEKTKLPYIIESHIERGVTISSLYDYLKDKKLRVLVLRLRVDHALLLKDPMLPHKAAKAAYDRAMKEHIPYDFEMNSDDNTKLFCSEVVSSVYKDLGINLWMGISSISAKGVANWLAGFGVTNFENQAPSDLEYDPQLTVVAEWSDLETLYNDHIDNAVVEAVLDEANAGKKLEGDWYLLPFARLLKFYSVLLNYFGYEGSVPEGMSAESALRHTKFVALHKRIRDEVNKEANSFYKKNFYSPPYWQMVQMAKRTIIKHAIL